MTVVSLTTYSQPQKVYQKQINITGPAVWTIVFKHSKYVILCDGYETTFQEKEMTFSKMAFLVVTLGDS